MKKKKNESCNFSFFFFSLMPKTAVGRQRMNNAGVPSRPSYGCAINMECGTSESFRATGSLMFAVAFPPPRARPRGSGADGLRMEWIGSVLGWETGGSGWGGRYSGTCFTPRVRSVQPRLLFICRWAEAPRRSAPPERGHLWLTAQVTGKLMISKSVYSVSWLVDQSRS